jgi:hypothetical protein
MSLGSTQPLTEISTRNIPGGKERPARKSDNLTAICEPVSRLSRKCGSLNVSQLYGSSWPIIRIALPFLYEKKISREIMDLREVISILDLRLSL